MKPIFTLGLMSGTSVDAIDASLVRSSGAKDELILHRQFAYPEALRRDVLSLVKEPTVTLPEFTRIHYEIGHAFASAAEKTLKDAEKKKLVRSRSQVCAIGSHGQTVFHDPAGKRTLQIGEASLIALKTGLTTVSDFRVADTAAGGEGAPLLPFYHRRLFSAWAREGVVVHNLGGISNFTYVGPKQKIFALDNGPANCLMDGAMEKISGGTETFDAGGKLARSGIVSEELLEFLKNRGDVKAFRAQRAPKSTGRELFSPKLLAAAMESHKHLAPENLLRTLTQFTVDLIVESYDREIFRKRLPCKRVVLAGGGARNEFLLDCLKKFYPKLEFTTMEDHGWSSQALESQAFGYFAWMALQRKPITFPTTTGAKLPPVCGKVSFPGAK